MSCTRTRGVTPQTACQNCSPNGQRKNGACLPRCPPRVWDHSVNVLLKFSHASQGVLHGYGRCYISSGLKMSKIQPTRILVGECFGHNWAAVSSNPDETGVKRTPSTRFERLRRSNSINNISILHGTPVFEKQLSNT